MLIDIAVTDIDHLLARREVPQVARLGQGAIRPMDELLPQAKIESPKRVTGSPRIIMTSYSWSSILVDLLPTQA